MAEVREPDLQEQRNARIIEAVVDELPCTPGPDQAQGTQDPEMLRNRRLAHANDSGKVTGA